MVANPAPVDGLLHQLMAFNFQQSFWWRRISQRSREVYYITIVCYYIVCNSDIFFSSERGWEIGQATFEWRISSW